MSTHSHAGRVAWAAAAVVIGLVAGGCASTGADRSPQPLPPNRIADGITVDPDPMRTRAVPASGQAEQGVLYAFTLYSHCGLGYWLAWDFDSSFWDPVEAQEPFGNPPEGIRNGEDQGTIELTGAGQARYTSSGGVVVELRRSPDQEREGMLCL